MQSDLTHVASVMMGTDSITVALPILDPASLKRALLAASSTYLFAAMTAFSADRGGGLSGAVDLGSSSHVESACDRALESLMEDGYVVSVSFI